MTSLFGKLFSSKSYKSHKRQTKMQKKYDKYHKLKLEHKKSKSKKCCRCAGLNMSKSINCRMGVYPTCKKSGCINKKNTKKVKQITHTNHPTTNNSPIIFLFFSSSVILHSFKNFLTFIKSIL